MHFASNITNRFTDFRLLELSQLTRHPGHRGPYMVVQEGVDPKDIAGRECTFVLTHKGTWMHFYLFLMLPKAVRNQFAVFETIADVMQLAEALASDPIVETVETLQSTFSEAGLKPGEQDPTAEALFHDLKLRKVSAANPAVFEV